MPRFISPLGHTPETKNIRSSSNLVIRAQNAVVDANADITLDAGGDEIIFKDGNSSIGQINMGSDNLTIKSLVSNKDIILQGNDGGSEITALTLDMSAAGKATFNNEIVSGAVITSGAGLVIADAGNIGSASDTDAIAIASDGVVTMNQIPVFSAGINVSGGTIAGTLATAAQTNITSLGTLTTLTVDNVVINGATIGHGDDTDLMTVADGILTVAGEVSVTTLDIGGTNVTSTAAELNILDGVTSTAAELNILDGVTSTAAELNILDGVTSTAAELNVLDGITAVVGELNALDLGSTAVGTAIASKAVILDSNKDYTGMRNLTISGEIDAATGDFSGAVDIAGATTTAAITASGIIKTDDTTAATSTTDGSLQTDGGLSVAKDAVIGDDIIMLSEFAQIAFGADSEITLKHTPDVGLRLTHAAGGDNLPVVFQLKSEEDAIIADEVIASIEFAAGDGSGTDAATVAAGIHAIAEDTFTASVNKTKLVFTTGVSETAASSATAKMTLSSAGLLTIADDFVIKDGGTIGSASDTDAIAIASDGVVTMNQIPVFSAGINVSGGTIAGTLATAAQGNITSLGTLTTLTVDNVVINGATIGHGDDTDLMTVADGILTVAGEVSMTTLDIGGTNVTSTAAELNILDGVTSTAAELNILDGVTSTAAELNILDGVTSTAAELNALDGITAVVGELNALDLGSTAVGTAIASKAVILDSNKDYTGMRNLTISGELDAGSLDISGDVDVDGTLEADAITVNGKTLTEFVTDTAGAMVSSNTETGITVTFQDDDNTIDFALAAAQTTITSLLATDIKIGEDDQTKIDFETADEIHFYAANAHQIKLVDGALVPVTDNDVDLGTSSAEFKDAFFDGTVTSDAFAGPLTGDVTGTSSKVTVTNSTANTNFPVVFNDESDSLLDDTGALRYNPSSGTLLVPNLVVAGTTTQVDTVTMNAQNAVIFEGATADDHETTLTIIDPTGDRTINLPNVSGTIPVLAAASTTQVTSTPEELNILDGATVVVGEINALDLGSTAVGTAIASKAVILDSNKDYTGMRNLTISGELDAGSLDVSGNVDVDGTLETDAFSIGGTTVTSTAAELNILDGVTSTAAELNILDGVTSTAAELNILDGVTSTAAELNALDGITAVVGELNALDIGSTAVGTAVASKAVILDSNKDYTGIRNLTISGELDAGSLDVSGDIDVDGTTNLDVVDIDGAVDMASTLGVAGVVTANAGVVVDNITIDGTEIDLSSGDLTLDVAGDIILNADGADIKLADASVTFGHLSNSSSDFVIESKVQDKDIIFKGDDGGSGITALTLDMSNAGAATFNHHVIVGDNLALASDSAIAYFGNSYEISLTHVHNVGLTLTNTIADTDNRPIVLQLKSEEDAIVADDVIASIEMAAGDSDGTDGATVAAGIHAIAEDTFSASANKTKLVFTTGVSETADSSAAAKMSLTSNGDLFLSGGLIDLKNDGSAVSQIKFYCESSNAHAQTLIGAPHSEAADNVLTLPGTGGDARLVSTTSTATLTNKTLTTPVIAEIDSGSTITLDATTDIVLDAGGDEVIFKDGSTNVGHVSMDSDNLTIKSLVSDKDIILQGNDGGSGITALTLDMSNAGYAEFNSGVDAQEFWINKDTGIMYFGADYEIFLQHVHNTGLRLRHWGGNATLQFGAANESISSDGGHLIFTSNGVAFDFPSADGSDGQVLKTNGSGVLSFVDAGSATAADDIAAGDAAVNITTSSGNITIDAAANDSDIILKGTDGGADTTFLTIDGSAAGEATFNAGIVIADAGNIGSASDKDAIAIASDGVVTFSQAPVFPDGSIAVADLDIDGAADIGAAIVDADLFIIDDGAGGTNRKTTASRLKSYINAATSATAADDIAEGDAAVNITTSSGNITIDAAANNSDIILKGTDGGADITMATFSGADAGTLILNHDLELGIDASVIKFGADNEILLTHVHDTGLLLTDSGGTPTLQFHDANESISSDGGHLIFTSNGVAFDFPSADGSDGQVLVTNGSGVLSFADGGSGGSSAADDISAGDAAVNITTSSGNITIDAAANDSDIILKGTDGGADTTFLTIDGSAAGEATFNAGIVIADAGNIGSASDKDAIAIGSDGDVTLTQDLELQHDGAILSFGANDEIALTHVHDTGLLLTDSGGYNIPTLQFVDANESISSDGGHLIFTSNGVAFDFPSADGSDGQVLKTNGSGVLSFADASAASSLAADDLTVGDAAITLATSAGNITIDAQGSNTDILFKGTDGSSDITALTLDMSDKGKALFNASVKADYFHMKTDGRWIYFGNSSEINLQHVHNVGLRINNAVGNPTLQFEGADESISSDNGHLIFTSNGVTFDFPSADGSDGQALVTNGSGVLAFANTVPAYDDITAGDAEVNITTSSGNIIIDAAANDTDIILKGTDGGADITALTLDMSDAGTAIFNHDIELGIDGSLIKFGADNEISLTHVHDTGLLLTDSGGTPTLQLHDANESISSDGGHLIFTSNGVAFDFPSADGSNGQVLVTNGSAVLSFADGPAVNIADLDIDGTADIGAAIDDADLFIIDDGGGGTNRKTTASRLKSYINAATSATAADDIAAGDSAVTLTTDSGNITIDAAANDTDIILKGTDGGADTTFLTIDGSAAGEATFNAGIVIADAGNIGSASDKDAIAIASNGVVNFTQTPTVASAAVKFAGKESIFIPAAAMYPSTTNGCAALAQVETTALRPDLKCLDFDASSDEFAQFAVSFPKSWNEGTVTFQPFWTVTGTNTGTVAWQLGGIAVSNDDSINTAFGTLVATTALAHSGTSNDLMVSAESGAVTIAGSPAADDQCFFQINRDVSADAQTGDARLLGIKLFFTTDAGNDA